MEYIQGSLFGKTYLEPSAAMTEKISEQSYKRSSGSSIRPRLCLDLRKEDGHNQGLYSLIHGVWDGDAWTPNTGESPKEEIESSLSQILLQEPVQKKYYLSEKACKGILRRSLIRGKTLPRVLENALLTRAGISKEEFMSMKGEWVDGEE